MRRTALPLLVVALLLVTGFSGWLYLQNRNEKLAYQDLSASEEQSRQNYNKTLDAIAAIQDSLDAITPRDESLKSGSLATEQDMAGPNQQQALERIATLRASIERNREKIRQLEASLAKSGERNKALGRMLANLQRTLADRQASLDQLSAQVDTLQGQVGSLQTEVAQNRDTLMARDAAIEDRRRELATVYYVVGTKKELSQQGAVVSKGGVLGMGKTLTPSPNLPAGALTPLDTDVSTVVPTAAKKAQVLTPQPASSYELRLVDGHIELHILDAAQFRKVRQLVIVTA